MNHITAITGRELGCLEFAVILLKCLYHGCRGTQVMHHDPCLAGLEGISQIRPAFGQVILSRIYIVTVYQIFLYKFHILWVIDGGFSVLGKIVVQAGICVHQHLQCIGAACTAADTKAVFIIGRIRHLLYGCKEIIPVGGNVHSNFL